MSEDIETRILQLLEVRLERTAEISPSTIRTLTENQADGAFCEDDDDLLEAIVERNDE